MTNQETLIKYVSDSHAAEQHLAQTLKNQIDDSDLKRFPEAISIVSPLLARTEKAMANLESLLKTLGGGEARSGLKETVTAATGAVMGVMGKTRTHEVSKMLRDDYTTLTALSIGYELLHATGNALESPPVASLAISHLKEVAGFIMQISQGVIPIAVRELAETNSPINAGVVEKSQENIKNVWQSA